MAGGGGGRGDAGRYGSGRGHHTRGGRQSTTSISANLKGGNTGDSKANSSSAPSMGQMQQAGGDSNLGMFQMMQQPQCFQYPHMPPWYQMPFGPQGAMLQNQMMQNPMLGQFPAQFVPPPFQNLVSNSGSAGGASSMQPNVTKNKKKAVPNAATSSNQSQQSQSKEKGDKAVAEKPKSSTTVVFDPKYKDVICYNCGEPGHYVGLCAVPKCCFMCGKPGHYMNSCPEIGRASCRERVYVLV